MSQTNDAVLCEASIARMYSDPQIDERINRLLEAAKAVLHCRNADCAHAAYMKLGEAVAAFE